MKKYLVPAFALMLAGCSDGDWNNALNYAGLGNKSDSRPQASVEVQPAATEPSPPANSDFCRAVATQDATGNDFDSATQARVFARSYAQCLTIYTH